MNIEALNTKYETNLKNLKAKIQIKCITTPQGSKK
jgi:hypothetical protein